MTPPKKQGATGHTRQLQCPCPNCEAPSLYSHLNPHRPFCSVQCQTGDLAAWASDEYRVPGTPVTQELRLSDQESREME
jgi:endogenous inhibitor of DNA gyrase (YacG/DUF329 family)